MIQAWLPALAGWDEDFDVDLTEGLAGGARHQNPNGFFWRNNKRGREEGEEGENINHLVKK